MKAEKAIVFGVLLTLAVIAFTGIASASTNYVPDDYSTIQAAVNAASPGDTIIVRAGTYIENIEVDKKRLTIRSENGPDSTIVLAEDPNDYVFKVTADYVKISGFTVEGATEWRAGISLVIADYCNISNNKCSKNKYGIHLADSNNNSISNNKCSNNEYSGIVLVDSNNNCISNKICSNNIYGISLGGSNNNKLKGNVMVENGIVIFGSSLSDYLHEIDTSNTVNGKPVYYRKDVKGGRIPEGAGQVILVNCKNVVVENQNLKNASIGIEVAFSSFITIKNNNCSNNRFGILGRYAKNNSISNNNCSNNDNGIQLEGSKNNSISNNNCSNNKHCIRLCRDSNNNHIYLNNFINNAYNVYNVYPSESTNTWNSPEKITYTYGRRTYTSLLGNYYDDYTGTDRNRDGIGDIPYQIDEDSDMYPLMKRWENYHAASERQSEVIYFILRWILED